MSRSSKIIAVSMVVLLLLMLGTQPARLPAALLALPFVLIAVIIYTMLFTILQRRGRAVAGSIRWSLIGTSLPMLILVLQTFGQLTMRDLATMLAIFAIAYFYLSRIAKPVQEP